jgi:hypothetical protein
MEPPDLAVAAAPIAGELSPGVVGGRRLPDLGDEGHRVVVDLEGIVSPSPSHEVVVRDDEGVGNVVIPRRGTEAAGVDPPLEAFSIDPVDEAEAEVGRDVVVRDRPPGFARSQPLSNSHVSSASSIATRIYVSSPIGIARLRYGSKRVSRSMVTFGSAAGRTWPTVKTVST